MASRIASELGVAGLELDAVRHQKNWEPLPDPEFAERVSSFVTRAAWVVDGNYFSLVTETIV